MKSKKFLSLILALCIMMSMLSVGILSATAAEGEESVDVAAEADTDTAVEDTETTGEGEEVATEATEAATETVTEAATEAEQVGNGKWEFGYPAKKAIVYNLEWEATGDDLFMISAIDALKDSKYFKYSVVQALASKKVSGENRKDYVFLCYQENKDTRSINTLGYQYAWTIATVRYAKTSAKYLTDKTVEIELDNIKTTDKFSIPWDLSAAKIADAEDYSPLPQSVISAIQGYDKIKLDMIAHLGIQKLYGTNYRFLCYGTKDSKTEIYVVDVNEKGANAEVTNVSLFDLASYMPTSSLIDDANDLYDKTEEVNASNAAAQQSGSNGSGNSGSSGSSGSQSGGSSASSTSPKTGQSETVAFIMLGVILMSAGVVYFVRKRERA